MHDYGCSCILYRKVHSPRMADKELHPEGWLSGSRAFQSNKQESKTRKTDTLGPGRRQRGQWERGLGLWGTWALGADLCVLLSRVVWMLSICQPLLWLRLCSRPEGYCRDGEWCWRWEESTNMVAWVKEIRTSSQGKCCEGRGQDVTERAWERELRGQSP